MWTLTDRFAQTSPALRGSLLLIALLLVSALVRQDMPVAALISRVGAPGVVDPELQRAAERGALCSDSNPTGVGLRGEYFAKEKWQGPPLLVRTDAGVDFDTALDWNPAGEATQRPRSVRWTGWVKPPVSGRYQFHVRTPGATVTVARQVFARGDDPAQTSVELHAGRYAPVVIEISPLPLAGSERIQFEWTTPYGARFVVPRALLFMPSGNVAAVRP